MVTEHILNGMEIHINRLALGLTLEDLSNETFISKQMLSLMEKGQHSSQSKQLLCTLVIEKLWSKIPEDEIAWRRECALQGINVKSKGRKDDIEFIKMIYSF